ncbi:hypothetical protein [Candidatus Chloroploca sp. Khr17]|uniref:hypothetical protein n=1 Tax=Candidatus Chloroploca sp. Khr17 TaxID=2496869 RepID=UPI00101C3071|nr:hypothetical protein [Candidatus Chloroploca sp. Khr17]
MSSSNSYSWMPEWLRKFLNLDSEPTSYGSASSVSTQSSYSPPARQSFSYTPPQATYTPSTQATYTPPEATYTPSTQATYTPPSSGEASTANNAETPPRFAIEGSWKPNTPPPPAPRTNGNGSGNGNGSSYNLEGYVQPIGYGVRTYLRGSLPPQGLEQFTREFRATLTDVWNFYSYWTRFQTDELVRIGREAVDTVIENLPGDSSASSAPTVRRIKVNMANGNGQNKASVAPEAKATPEAKAAPEASDGPPPPAASDKPADASDSAAPSPSDKNKKRR